MGGRVWRGQGEWSPYYVPEVKYEFDVNGVVYSSQFSEKECRTEVAAQVVLEKHYQAGKTLTIYYDPNDPRRSTVDKGDAVFWATGFLVPGTLCLLVGALLHWAGKKLEKRIFEEGIE